MASIQHRSDRPKPWRVAYRDPQGRQRSQSFARKAEATQFRAKVEHEMNRGAYIDPHAGRVTMADLAADWLDRQTFDAPTRIAVESRLRVHIEPHLGTFEVRAIKPSTVQQWVRTLSRDLAASYVALLLGHLKSILGAAVDDGIIARNPAASRSVKTPRAEHRRVVPWTVEQVRAIADAHPERYRALPILAAGTGLRQGECFGLALEDVDFLRRVVHVRQQVRLLNGHPVYAPPKSGREREVPLPDTVAVALSQHLRTHPAVEVTLPWGDRNGPSTTRRLVFSGPKGASLNKNPHTQRVWIPALADAGIAYVPRETGMHQLRHHYASVLLDAGVSIAALASYLGHADPSVTLRVYSHLMPNTEGRARQAVDAAHQVAQSLPRTAASGD
jgi:integrase